MNQKPPVWFALFVIGVFVAGAATALLLQRYLEFPVVAGGAPPFGRSGPPPPGGVADRLAEELQLTTEQRRQVEQIFETRRQALEDLQADVHARFDKEREALTAELERILTPEQSERLRAFNERMRARSPGRRPFGRPPPPPVVPPE